MSLQLDEIRTLMQDLENSSLREFSLQSEDFSLHLSKNEISQPVVAATTQPETAAQSAVPEKKATEGTADLGTDNSVLVEAPLVGTVYLKPKPDAAPFKEVGDHVQVGEQVAIIEAMKLMTPVKSEVTGVIKEILVEEEDVVDYGHALFRVQPDA
ncbi:acetyl-CoA carboxylase biotin carboxyl carrier protein [Weissella paramesenteroides]|jgi:acetyl-CoA carboxylase biotin carboxyl carrier protein|uniref:acetyl-CoA carboxylase biotin carboxyl carrier protein n=1 Tax=Weissella paramesenteroides TaxID=1249 RepID=UPI001239E476|nr:acetyl-CoA carboxylase biotin carboxyl carrier protein [Weissella paramesenteroides]KAA8454137.1 acetyl-CoA carboxylase biotin carboxyl carrier protein [Weissella paramesenteroides]KAA8457896.1 acetyl-CoA carboxylase biotin carboxyl carrier protein [Weissella paramesenteroides]KAA8459907.1 acetyl-CoA carboxylase biotin carboxyl carrier protein [Weissella paramesenteroides]KAA8461903.1 acetyl-CoA carboxylase biotin carboxyl carrier protein [Weissella paramesenteroides]KAA8462007.1 acetyl-CoA